MNTHFFAVCKSAAFRFGGSNPPSPTKLEKPLNRKILGLFVIFLFDFMSFLNIIIPHAKRMYVLKNATKNQIKIV